MELSANVAGFVEKGAAMSFSDRAMEGEVPGETAVSPWAVGFTVFAAVVMMMNGIFNFFQGLAAVIEDEFFLLTRNYAFDLDVTTWGWVHLVTGVIVSTAGFFLFSGALWARLVAIAVAVVSSIINFFYIPYYPVWSILIIVLNIGVIWALTFHGRDIAAE